MLILAKSVLSLMIGFLASLVLGLIIVPILRRTHINQNVSIYLKDAHKKKDGTPTMGGIIFIIGTFLSIIALLFMKKIDFSPNLFITLFVFVSYALIGFLDDYLSVKKKQYWAYNNSKIIFAIDCCSSIFLYLYEEW